MDALADGALAEAVAACNKKCRHQTLAVDEREKSGQGQTAEALQRIQLGRVRKYDSQHPGALQHIEHADGVDGAGFCSFHEQDPSLRRPPLKVDRGAMCKNL